jgi:hypothetical protein
MEYQDDKYRYFVTRQYDGGGHYQYWPRKMELDAKVMHSGSCRSLGAWFADKGEAEEWLERYAEEHMLRMAAK